MLYLNRTAWQRAGLDPQRPPRTWAELEDATRRLARRAQGDELEVLGFNPAVVPWWWWVWQLGGEVIDATGERVLLDRGDAAVRALEFEMGLVNAQGGRDALTRLHLANGVAPADAGNPSVNYNQMFQLGRVATWLKTLAPQRESARRASGTSSGHFTGAPPAAGGAPADWAGAHLRHPYASQEPRGGLGVAGALLAAGERSPVRHPLRPRADPARDGDLGRVHPRRRVPGAPVEQAWYPRFLPAVPGLSDILPLGTAPWSRSTRATKPPGRGRAGRPRDAAGARPRHRQAPVAGQPTAGRRLASRQADRRSGSAPLTRAACAALQAGVGRAVGRRAPVARRSAARTPAAPRTISRPSMASAPSRRARSWLSRPRLLRAAEQQVGVLRRARGAASGPARAAARSRPCRRACARSRTPAAGAGASARSSTTLVPAWTPRAASAALLSLTST